MGKKKQQQQQQQQAQQQQAQQQQAQPADQNQGQNQQQNQGIPQDPTQQQAQDQPVYQGSDGGQPVGSQPSNPGDNAGLDQNVNPTQSSGGNSLEGGGTFKGGDSIFDTAITSDNKWNIIIIVFGSVISLYIVISAIIYFASFIVKNKEDDLTEDFYKEITKEKKENNQFFMDPALHKSPVIKAAAEKEEGTYPKSDNKEDYEHIWDTMIVTGKNNDIEVDTNRKSQYPSTTPITPISPSPLQQSFTNESYNMARDADLAQKRSIGHRESNSTSSSTASVSNLIPKSQKKANEAYNNEDIGPRSPPVPAHHQFPNGSRPNGPQIKFSMDQKHDNRGQLSPPGHQGSQSASPRSPRPGPGVERQGSRPQLPPISRGPERQGSQGSPRPQPRGPDRQGSQGSPSPRPQPRGPDRQGSQTNSPRLPPPRSVNPDRQGPQGSPRPQPRGPDRQGSQGSPRPQPRGPDRQGSHGNIRPPQNSRPQPRH